MEEEEEDLLTSKPYGDMYRENGSFVLFFATERLRGS
jgi:hypothetical protein